MDATRSVSTASFSISITDAGSYDANGFSTTTPFYHRVTGNKYDENGYNKAGYNNLGLNAANDYNEIYDESLS